MIASDLQRRVELLRADYAQATGRPFAHFYCPIVFRDEPVALCRGHIVSQAFEGADAKWVVQRADVDNFFGHAFEGDFAHLDEQGRHDLLDVLSDRALRQKLRPQLRINGEPVSQYLAGKNVPEDHAQVILERPSGPPTTIALKMKPSDVMSLSDGVWEIGFERDLRLPALVSVLKAAHLTLFDLLGYQYALSLGGRFLGWDILGSFFAANRDRSKDPLLPAAQAHFRQFANLARPIIAAPQGLLGTAIDGKLYLCSGSSGVWAFMVFVRTGEYWHGVLAPVMDNAESAARYLAFMANPAPRLWAKYASYDDGQWTVSPDEYEFQWPRHAFDGLP